MARFDFYENPGAAGYLLDVQSTLIGGLNTRIVVPLMPEQDAPRPARRLNPVFEIANARYVMVTQFMAAVPVSELGTRIGSLEHAHDEITSALDMIFLGF
jgi:toxin CcdB